MYSFEDTNAALNTLTPLFYTYIYIYISMYAPTFYISQLWFDIVIAAVLQSSNNS